MRRAVGVPGGLRRSPLPSLTVVAEGLRFPEGPVAMPDGSVIVVEILAGTVVRVGLEGDKSIIAVVRGGPNGAAIGPDGALYVCNNGGPGSDDPCSPGIQRVCLSTGEVTALYTSCDGRPLVSPNDLVFDQTGHFWFTDFRGDAIYYAAADGSAISRRVSDVPAPNGIGLSPDGTVVYWSQTNTRQVVRRRLLGPGEILESPGHDSRALRLAGLIDPFALLVGLPGAMQLDSLALEAGGSVAVGTLVDSGIAVVTPYGEAVELLELPPELDDGYVTNICFGGHDLRTAYLTLSLTGRLVRCMWPRAGLRLAFQQLPPDPGSGS